MYKLTPSFTCRLSKNSCTKKDRKSTRVLTMSVPFKSELQKTREHLMGK
jgi:hypothetical protein